MAIHQISSLASDSKELEDRKKLKDMLKNRVWRRNHLYYITDKGGQKVRFKLNWAQRLLLKNMWYLNIVLKARQLGMSTFIQIYMLDACLFNSNMRTGVIADNRDNAKILFRDTIKFAYDNLPDWLKVERQAKSDSAQELMFNNNSSIRVGTSMRGSSMQILHISEFGKICRKDPKKAKEIVTGALNTVQAGQMIFIESTAEGREGKFYAMCKEAMKAVDAKLELSKLDYKFFFFSWWEHPDYVLDAANVVIFPPLKKYFNALEAKHGIKLSLEQKAWYAKKQAVQGEDMKQEYPSTPDEAFEQTIQGAYFAAQLTKARQQGRISKVPHTEGFTVDTWWDLGINDTMCCWFTQTIGMQVNVIDYYENSGEGLQHYKDVLDEKSQALGYRYGRHVWPHDGVKRQNEKGKLVKLHDQAADIGWIVEIHPRTPDLAADINNARNFISKCWFDEARCDSIETSYADKTGGLVALESFRKEWNEHLGAWKNTPLHNWASHAAAAFRTLAGAHEAMRIYSCKTSARPIKKNKATGWT